MEQDVAFYDRLATGSPEKNYAYLLRCAKTVVERHRLHWYRDELSRSIGATGTAAPAGGTKGNGKGSRKGDDKGKKGDGKRNNSPTRGATRKVAKSPRWETDAGVLQPTKRKTSAKLILKANVKMVTTAQSTIIPRAVLRKCQAVAVRARTVRSRTNSRPCPPQEVNRTRAATRNLLHADVLLSGTRAKLEDRRTRTKTWLVSAWLVLPAIANVT